MEDIEFLFTYGSLQDVDIQKAIFGRYLKGWPDGLPGFELSEHKAYGSYPIAVRTDDNPQGISGTTYALKTGELDKADAYEGPQYERVLVDLKSGKKAWLYVGA